MNDVINLFCNATFVARACDLRQIVDILSLPYILSISRCVR